MGLVLFRADANSNIGIGHVMRCLSIADAATRLGHSVFFLLAGKEAIELVRARSYEYYVMNTDYSQMDLELNKWPKNVSPNTIVVDSYFVTQEYFRNLKEKYDKSKLVYIDDQLSFAYPVDTLVNYNAFAKREKYEELYSNERDIPRFILGPSYVPIRDMFIGIDKRVQPKCVKNILVSTGGSDAFHITLKLINILKSDFERYAKHTYHFLIGAMNSDKEEILKAVKHIEYLRAYEQVSDMRGMIESCDMAVSAAGSTLYEICACGVPVLTYALADNQLPGAEAFQELGLAINVGDLRCSDTIDKDAIFSGTLQNDWSERLIRGMQQLADDYELRCSISAKMQSLIDGHGADRLVEEL